MPNSDGGWYVRLTDGSEYLFYHGSEDSNPLEAHDAFDCGDAWSMDIHELHGTYPADPEDDSFVRIPKDDVDDVFFAPYESDDGPDEPIVFDV